ncbi:MAG TPA: metallophosphoesterase [Terriglobales bacterium]|nr:metallophosphoesterase [Terriglobales bacterium]
MPEFHAEPYLYLAAVTHKAALIAWGGFYFRVRTRAGGDEWKLVDDSDLDHVHPPRRETIGARSEPYGKARVEVFDGSGALVSFAETINTNHAWVTGLAADTEYKYRVLVNGEDWAQGERRDWSVAGGVQGLYRSGKQYDNRFRTQPLPEASVSFTFAVIGDFGVGIRKPSSGTRRQREIAMVLERAVAEHDVRLLITTGDNIYAAVNLGDIPLGETGDEDDDWFFTYYQPYRYILNRVPVYPAVGNHDAGETEINDDRLQLFDNFFLQERFKGDETAGRASLDPGLFYKFRWGADAEFVCVDTSRNSLLFGKRFFEHPNHQAFLDSAFPSADTEMARPKWRIVFSHHPPFCAGPKHGNTRSMVANLLPLFERGGVRVVFSGHEHNFQHSREGKLGPEVTGGIDYFISGAGGKIRLGTPSDFVDAKTLEWAAEAHFLLVKLEGDSMTVTPMGENGPIERQSPSGAKMTGSIVLRR